MPAPIEYDEFSLLHENAAEFGLPFPTAPAVRRQDVEIEPGRSLSSLCWGVAQPELVLLHGGAQNAHTWDTVAIALDRPLIAIDLPGHGHSDGPNPEGVAPLSPTANAHDVAAVIARLAPEAKAVVGMSLGGLTTIALTDVAPELVRKVVLVDVTPGVTAQKSERIIEFVDGPATFASFDEMLERTMRFNPNRSESSLRRGILHNAVQRDDGTWVWRHQRWRTGSGELARTSVLAERDRLWDVVSAIRVPLLLCRGMREDSVVGDDDEAELRRRAPHALVERFEEAGHSIQGDCPVELARTIARFAL